MRALVFLLGLVLLCIIMWEAFETLILPRRVQRRLRLTRYFYRGTWRPIHALAGHIHNLAIRENLLSVFGPASLLCLFIAWGLGIMLGYALLFWGVSAQLLVHEGLHPSFWTDLYFSGTNFVTLGLGEVIPRSAPTRLLTVIEGANGLAFLAIAIAYLPTLYTAFSQREVTISLLDARAGSPATAGELLRRHSLYGDLSRLDSLLSDWEHWSAVLMENHISYSVLCFFRSQHANQSWLSAITTILDTCALVMIDIEGVSAWQARLTFAVCRHALVDISQVFHRQPSPLEVDRLPEAEFENLRFNLKAARVCLADTPEAYARLKSLRDAYEPYAGALSKLLLMPLPSWSQAEDARDNWTTSSWKSPSS